MKLPLSRMKWLLMFVGVCLVVAHYLIASSWLFPKQPPQPQSLPSNMELAAVIDQLQLDDSIVAAVGKRVIQDIALQVLLQLMSTLVRKPSNHPTPVPPLYIITPTYRRSEQIPELTRLAYTLMHVPNLHWLVIEDAVNKSVQVSQLLQRTGLSFDHLVAPMPDSYKNHTFKPKGVSNRNRGLEWLRENATTGVFYFADDDNTYDIALFQEMRDTKRVSMWPVGLCTLYGLSSPIVRNGRFDGFYDGWMVGRKFAVDMAGFAVSVKFLLQRPKAKMPYEPEYEEDGFLKSLAPFEPKDIELKADNCTKILVWHTLARKHNPAAELDLEKYNNTNLVHLRPLIV